ncbi:MAG: glycosyltransferase family 39 protein [Xanthobacteraceae bacterium]|nr:glycosyltransferase family 39 protein [Xanthobacteraceae bacterium]
MLDWVCATHRRAAFALIVVTLVCLLPGFASLPPSNRDESRYAQPTKQMIETGDYMDIRLQDQARYRKPIGIYWLQAAAVRAAEKIGFENARARIVFYRLPSLLAAIGAVLLTYWTALAFVSRRYAMLAALALATSILLGVVARLATIDASLLLTAVAAQGALARVYLGRTSPGQSAGDWPLAAIFWTAIAGSILLKGPIIPLIVGLTVAALAIADRSARWLLRLKPVLGLIWMLVLVLPWFLVILSRSEGAFYGQSVGRDFLGRLTEGAEGHGAPPGYYWLLFWISFWPAAPLAALAAPFAWANRREPVLRFLLAWIVPGWIVFELVVTKLPHYVLPFYPAFAILIALALERRAPADGWTKATAFLWPVIAILLPLAAILLVVFFEGRFSKSFWPFAAIGIAFGALAWWRLLTDNAERALVLVMIAAMANAIAVYTLLPRVQGIAVASRLVAAARAAPCKNPLLASAGYHEPNLVFLGGTATKLVPGAGAAEFLRLPGCRVAIVERREERAFADRAAALGLTATRISEVRGFDYSNWRWVGFLILVAKEGG